MIPKHIGHEIKYDKNLVGLIRRAFWEIPEVMGASIHGLIGIGLGIIGCYNYLKNDGESREYKMVYYILRDGDPKACLIRNPVYTEFPANEEDEMKRKLGAFLKPKEPTGGGH